MKLVLPTIAATLLMTSCVTVQVSKEAAATVIQKAEARMSEAANADAYHYAVADYQGAKTMLNRARSAFADKRFNDAASLARQAETMALHALDETSLMKPRKKKRN